MRQLGDESDLRLDPPVAPAVIVAAPEVRTRAAVVVTRPLRWAEATVAALAAVVFTWRIGSPSAWWDEAVTREVVTRPVSALFALAANVDLVHLTYYLGMHGLWLLAGSPTDSDQVYVLLRSVSALAGVLTAVSLVRIGRALGSARVGLVAGLLFVVSPLVSRYAQEARPYAFATLAATLSTLALIHAVARGGRRRWATYALLIGATGLLNEIALLVLAAHLVHVVVPAGPRRAGEWLRAAALPVVVLLPFVYATSRQSGQVGWLDSPSWGMLTRSFRLQWEAAWVVLPVVVVLVALAATARRWPAVVPSPHRHALLLGGAWAVLPPVLLWLISQAEPMFVYRYLVFCIPGSALALASVAGLALPLAPAKDGGRGRAWAARGLRILPALLVVVLAAMGLSTQGVYRDRVRGHGEDLRGAAEVVQRDAQPGDAVLFITAQRRVVSVGYPEAFAKVTDIALDRGDASAQLFGSDLDPASVTKALGKVDRVWVVSGERRSGDVLTDSDRAKGRVLAKDFVEQYRFSSMNYSASLFVRKDAPAPVRAKD